MERIADNQICVKISVSSDTRKTIEEVVYYRNRLPMAIVEKWRWYFEYLAARVKVRHPYRRVELVIVHQTLLQGQEYIEKKTADLLRAKRSQLKRIQNETIHDDDLFGYKKEQRSCKIESLQEQIKRLERGEVDFYVPPTYINRIKEWI